MSKRNIQEWYKFAFKLFVNEQWSVIAERVENGDQTYRWVKEQLLLAIQAVEREGWEKPLGAAAFPIKQRLESFKSSILSEDDYLSAQHWLKRVKMYVSQLHDDGSRCSVQHKLLGAKLALLATAIVDYDEPTRVGAGICSVFNTLTDVDEIVDAIYENKDPKLAYEVKVVYDLAKEYAQTMMVPLDDLVELEFEPSCIPSEPSPVFKPPEIWAFGDFGEEDGQLYYPDCVHVDKEGNFLIMDQDVTGDGIPQRIQLFNPLGKFIKVILRRGAGKVNSMRDFCLNKTGYIVVADTDDEDRARIQVFDYDGNQQLVINPDKDNPESTSRVLSVATDEDDNIICADMGLACVWVYSSEGKVKSKFGKWGREEGNFMNLQRVHVANNKLYAFNNGVNYVKTQEFDYNGTYIRELLPGYAYSQLVFHTDGQIYAVADHYIDKIDLEGNREVVVGKDDGYGTYLEDFFHLSSMEFLQDGRIVTTESGNHRVKVFNI